MININDTAKLSVHRLQSSGLGSSKLVMKYTYREIRGSIDHYQYLRYDAMPHKNTVKHWDEVWLRRHLYVTGRLTSHFYIHPMVFCKFIPGRGRNE